MHEKIIVENESQLIKKLCETIENVANINIAEKNTFFIGLSGGSMINFLVKGLPQTTSDFSKWRFLFCDERIVPENDGESTFGSYWRQLAPVLNLKRTQFLTIDNNLSAEENAEFYEKQLKTWFPDVRGVPKIDLLLLGLGPDGHTCSLFPGHQALNVRKKLITFVLDSPKEPKQRITMTFELLNQASFVIFALSGESKASVVKRILIDEDESLPATKIKLQNGKNFWIMDKSAAKLLT